MNIGDKFGRLTVVALKVEVDKGGNVKHLFGCECGNQKVIRQSSVISGYTHSCGCLAKEVYVKQAIKMGAANMSSGKRQNRKNKTSIFKGVCWLAKNSRWHGQLRAEGVNFHLGLFDSEVQAAEAYDAAAKELHENPVLNFPSPEGHPHLYTEYAHGVYLRASRALKH